MRRQTSLTLVILFKHTPDIEKLILSKHYIDIEKLHWRFLSSKSSIEAFSFIPTYS